MKKSHSVSVLSQKLVIRSEADGAYVDQVAGYVNGKVQQVLDQTKTASTLTASLLACLNVADELFQERRGRKDARGRAAKKVREIIGLIDVELQSEQSPAVAG